MFSKFRNMPLKRLGKTTQSNSTSNSVAETITDGQAERLSVKTKSIDTGISVRIGEDKCAEEIFIPQAAMNACPYFKEVLEQDACLPYVEPGIFHVVIDFLSMSFIEKMTGVDSTAFAPLLEDDDALLCFAKTWSLGHELELPDLQNKLVDVYSQFYAKLLTSRERNHIMPSAEAFAWIRDHIANHTPAEKFLVDFVAGMRRLYDGTSSDTILDQDIAGYIEMRWGLIADLGDKADRILSNDPIYKVSKKDKHVQMKTVKIVPPPHTPPTIPTSFITQSTSNRPIMHHRNNSSISVRTVCLSKVSTSSFVSFPPPKSLEETYDSVKEDNSDEDTINCSQSPELLKKSPSS
ncbi:hypothetical protein N0V90_003861 [Kalmusia sp. IMI 367209]|nr:hypothetical protein N0V90_003861 [Kalmusia sp. IMI 367209]